MLTYKTNTIEQLVQMLHSITEYDIIDYGYDDSGHKRYVIRNLAENPSVLSLGKLEMSMFPEWRGKSNN